MNYLVKEYIKTIKINYGVLFPPLKEQVEKQGYELEEYKLLEKLRYSINLLKFHISTENITEKLFYKLNKRVIKNIKLNKNENIKR